MVKINAGGYMRKIIVNLISGLVILGCLYGLIFKDGAFNGIKSMFSGVKLENTWWENKDVSNGELYSGNIVYINFLDSSFADVYYYKDEPKRYEYMVKNNVIVIFQVPSYVDDFNGGNERRIYYNTKEQVLGQWPRIFDKNSIFNEFVAFRGILYSNPEEKIEQQTCIDAGLSSLRVAFRVSYYKIEEEKINKKRFKIP